MRCTAPSIWARPSGPEVQATGFPPFSTGKRGGPGGEGAPEASKAAHGGKAFRAPCPVSSRALCFLRRALPTPSFLHLIFELPMLPSSSSTPLPLLCRTASVSAPCGVEGVSCCGERGGRGRVRGSPGGAPEAHREREKQGRGCTETVSTQWGQPPIAAGPCRPAERHAPPAVGQSLAAECRPPSKLRRTWVGQRGQEIGRRARKGHSEQQQGVGE